MDQPLDPQKMKSAVQSSSGSIQSSSGSNGQESPSDDAVEVNSPEFQRSVDQLIEYVSEQIELLAFDEGEVAQLERLIVQMIKGLADPRRAQRIQLVDALSQIGEPATPFLLDALNSQLESVVRRACCHALSNIGDERAVSGLAMALAGDQDISVKSAAAGALAKIGAPAFDALRDLLASDTVSESCKGHAAWAMTSMSREVPARLYDCMKDPSPAVRTAAVGAIAQIAQRQIAQRQITPEQFTPEQITQKQTEKELSAAQPLSLLIQSLNDASSEVRIEAIAHLARLNYQQARGSLVNCLQDGQWEVRKAAILALGKLGSVSAGDALRTDASNGLVPMQVSIIETIAQLKQDPSEAVQQAAMLVVSQLESVP